MLATEHRGASAGGRGQAGCKASQVRTGVGLFAWWAGQGAGLLTGHGRVAQEAGYLLLAEFLLLVG